MEQQFYEQIKKFFLKPETEYIKLQTLQWWKHTGILERVLWRSRMAMKKQNMVVD